MLREKLNQLFTLYDPAIQTIISEVLELEQTFIALSMDKPRWKEPLDQIVTRIARKELERRGNQKD